MITTGQIYLAYRKLKGELYYDNNALLPKVTLAKWEQELTHNHVSCDKEEFENLFSDRVSLLLAFLNDNEWKSNNYLNQLLGSIDYQTIVKSISSDETDSGIGTYITNYKYKKSHRNLSLQKQQHFYLYVHVSLPSHSAPVYLHQ